MESLKASLNRIIQESEGTLSIAYSFGREELSINARRVYSSASVIKLLILITVYRYIESGKLKENNKIEFNAPYPYSGSCGVLDYLSSDTKKQATLHDLLTLMIIVSDNSASNILLDVVGFNAVTETINLIGANHTSIERHFCDPQAMAAGRDNYTSAADMLLVLKCLGEHNAIVNSESRQAMLKMLSQQQLRTMLPAYFPEDPDGGDLLIWNKTGGLPGVVHDVAVLSKAGKLGYVAVLSDGWSENADGEYCLSQIGNIFYRLLAI